MSLELYESVIRAMAEGVVVHDATGAIRSANPSAQRILGLTLDQMQGRAAVDPRWGLVYPDGRPVPPDQIPSEITARTGVPCHDVKLGVVRPGGEIAWLSVNTDAVIDEATKRPHAVVATFTDVTTEIEAKRALEHSRARLEHLMNAAPGVVYQYLLRPDGRDCFPFVSARGYELLGVPAQALHESAEPAWRNVDPEHLAEMRAHVVASSAAMTPWEYEFRIEAPPGNWRWLRGRANPERVPEGVLWTGVLMDVTSERQLADRVRRIARREAMGDMAASVAHNFNNLLAAIIPNVDLAADRDTTADERAAALEDASRAARSAADLVRQLMGFTRMDGGSRATIELGARIRETLRLCRRTFERSINLVERLAPTPLHVRGVPSHVDQIVMNLVLNARDAVADVADPTITVELTSVDGAAATLRVRDNGVGMSPDVQRHLGEPFFTTKGAAGTGLGVASVYTMVGDLGGRIACTSAVGAGTTFEIQLPCTGTAPAVTDAAAASAVARTGRVLVVDDDSLVRATIGRGLERLGFAVVTCASGDEAIARLDELAPSLRAAILDLAMPGLSGPDLVSLIASRWPKLPLVVLSGYPPAPGTLPAHVVVLTKPVLVRELAAALPAVRA